METGTILDQILARTVSDLASRIKVTPYVAMERLAMETPVSGSLREAISRPGVSLIAEFKRGSPSRGRFFVEIDPGDVAGEYVAGGAAAISVLTDQPFFQGSLADLTAAAAVAHSVAPKMAVLRKDFVIDEYQILEARAAGADAILLIVAALEQARLEQLMQFAARVGLDALVEVHEADELGRAEAAGAAIIGINNRDLRTFNVSLETTERLAGLRMTEALLVSESGIFTRQDVERLERSGADAILVGESLVLAKDRPGAIRALLGSGPESTS